MKKTSIFVALLTLSACTANGELSSVAPVGFTTINPTSNVRVGHLYFAGKGNEPAFVTSKGQIYSEVCYADFSKTRALINIGNSVVDEGITVSKLKTSDTGNLSGSATAPSFGSLGAEIGFSGSKTYTLEKLHTLRLSADGIETVRTAIKNRCRNEIKNLTKAKKQVVLATAAQRAEKLTIESSSEVNAQIGGGFKASVGKQKSAVTVEIAGGEKQGGGFKHSNSVELETVYLSVKPNVFVP